MTFSSENRKILKTNERETGAELLAVVGLTIKKERQERTEKNVAEIF